MKKYNSFGEKIRNTSFSRLAVLVRLTCQRDSPGALAPTLFVPRVYGVVTTQCPSAIRRFFSRVHELPRRGGAKRGRTTNNMCYYNIAFRSPDAAPSFTDVSAVISITFRCAHASTYTSMVTKKLHVLYFTGELKNDFDIFRNLKLLL